VIKDIQRYEVKALHVVNLADMLHGIIHTATRVEAEFDVTQQILLASQLIAQILEAVSPYVEEVLYYGTYGNHGRFTSNKSDALDTENFELLIPALLERTFFEFPNITFIKNMVDDQWITAMVAGHLIMGAHGDRDAMKTVAQNMTMMFAKPYKVFIAHKHHLAGDTIHSVQVSMVGSLCGVETYAKDIRKTSTPSQTFCVYDKKSEIHRHNIDLS